MVIGRAITMPAETLDLVELSSKKLSFMTLDDPNLINIYSNGKLNRYASLKWGVFSHWISENFLKGFKIEKSVMKPFFTESHGCYRLQLFLFSHDRDCLLRHKYCWEKFLRALSVNSLAMTAKHFHPQAQTQR